MDEDGGIGHLFHDHIWEYDISVTTLCIRESVYADPRITEKEYQTIIQYCSGNNREEYTYIGNNNTAKYMHDYVMNYVSKGERVIFPGLTAGETNE